MFLLNRLGQTAAGLLVMALLASISVPAKEVFTAIRARIAGGPGAPMTRVSITIESYTTDEEARGLLQAAMSGGTAAMVGAIRNLNKGVFSVTEAQELRINAARVYPSGSGRRIVIVCDRATNRRTERTSFSQALEYPFSVVELHLDNKGIGDGQLIEAASVRLDERGFVEGERYLTAPQLLVEVQMEQSKR